MRPPRFLPPGRVGGAHGRPPFRPGPISVRYALPTSRKSLPKQSAAGSAPTGAYWAVMTRPSPGRAASTAPSACPPRRPCSPWRASRRTSPTGTPTRSSSPTARPGSPPGSSRPRSTAWSTPVRWWSCTRPGTGCRYPSLARWLLGLGIAATLTANMAQGWSHGPVGAVVAAWPPVSLVGSYELLVWLIRACGAAGRRPSAEHPSNSAACREAAGPVPASAADAERPGGSERGTADPAWRPAGQAAGQSPITVGGLRDDEVLEASAVYDAAVAAYRLSVQAGNPLSERRLAQMFGRTSRRLARARIADARQASPLPDSPGIPVVV
jgi:hypothetical protein